MIEVQRAGRGFAVAVDGRPWQVDATQSGAHSLSLIVDNPGRKGASFEVTTIDGRSSGELAVYVGPMPLLVTVNGRRRWGRATDSAGTGGGPQRVTAPMPGKVIRLLVKPGDVVTPRQELVVVEAMKMENELRASRAGTVTEVHAREGLSVDAGALLVVIQ